MKAELTIWIGAVAMIAGVWCWDYRAGLVAAGVVLILAGVGMVLEGQPNVDDSD